MTRRRWFRATLAALGLLTIPGDLPKWQVGTLPQRFARSSPHVVPSFGHGHFRDHFGDRHWHPFVNALHHDIPPNSWLTLCRHGNEWHAAGFEEDPEMAGQKPPTLFEIA